MNNNELDKMIKRIETLNNKTLQIKTIMVGIYDNSHYSSELSKLDYTIRDNMHEITNLLEKTASEIKKFKKQKLPLFYEE